MTEMQARFIDQLKSIMEEREISAYRLSKMTGLSQAALSNFLNGIRSPSLESIEQIAAGLGIEPGDLLNRSNIEERVSGIPTHIIPLLKGHSKSFYDAIEAMAKASKTNSPATSADS